MAPALQIADAIGELVAQGAAEVQGGLGIPVLVAAGLVTEGGREIEAGVVVLEINGRGPETWPPPGMTYNPGPYSITVSETVAPAVAGFLDAAHKKPWSVAKIEVVNYAARFAAIESGAWAQLSARAVRGREIWPNCCLSCHTGPTGIPGGTKSGRRFEVLAALATCNKEYFIHYVRAPRELMPEAKMEAHPHYTADQFAALMAFITAEPRSTTGAPAR